MDWLIKNKVWEWLFSGIGVAVLAWLGAWYFSRKRRRSADEKKPTVSTGDSIHIQAGGDVSLAKDNGKSIQVKDSQVGVIGDHAEIKGGLHFNKPKQ